MNYFLALPSVEDVCKAFNMTDVNMDYNDAEIQALTTYKAFTKHVRPILQKENPKIPASKLMMLVEAKWNEFCAVNPQIQAAEEVAAENEEPRSSRSSRNEKVNFLLSYIFKTNVDI